MIESIKAARNYSLKHQWGWDGFLQTSMGMGLIHTNINGDGMDSININGDGINPSPIDVYSPSPFMPLMLMPHPH
jgi:hypothetical protein